MMLIVHHEVPAAMATLPGQRANFTYWLNRYNLAEDDVEREKALKGMAKSITAAPGFGFTVEEVTRGQNYPKAEVERYLQEGGDLSTDGSVSEQEAIRVVEQIVDTSDVVRIGEGSGVVYAYGYPCIGDRLKVDSTEADTVQRIAAQIGTSTPDKPALYLEIRINNCRALERAIQATLETQGKKISGGGAEWFRTTREEIRAIYEFVIQMSAMGIGSAAGGGQT